jgi:hypothetical protein
MGLAAQAQAQVVTAGFLIVNCNPRFLKALKTDEGHPDLLSSYRSKLGGILASLYIIHRICQYYRTTVITKRL